MWPAAVPVTVGFQYSAAAVQGVPSECLRGRWDDSQEAAGRSLTPALEAGTQRVAGTLPPCPWLAWSALFQMSTWLASVTFFLSPSATASPGGQYEFLEDSSSLPLQFSCPALPFLP